MYLIRLPNLVNTMIKILREYKISFKELKYYMYERGSRVLNI